MEQLKVTNLLKLYTLLLLYEGPKHGYELMKYMEDKIGLKASPGHIYPFLKKLVEIGLIELEEIAERDKKTYKLSESGRKWVERMIDRIGDLIDIAVEPKLTVCANCGCKVYEGGYREEIEGQTLAFCCEHCAHSYKMELEGGPHSH